MISDIVCDPNRGGINDFLYSLNRDYRCGTDKVLKGTSGTEREIYGSDLLCLQIRAMAAKQC